MSPGPTFSSTWISHTLNLCFSPRVTYEASHPYKVPDKIMVLFVLVVRLWK